MKGEVQGAEKALGKRIQEARQKAGLTQQDLCNKAGLSYSTLAKIERGAIRAPSIFTIESIADVIGVSLDELVGHEAGGTSKKTSKSGIEFVYFDINGCLVRFFHRAFTQLADDTGVPLDRIESAMWHYNDTVCKGEMSLDDFNQALAERLGLQSVDWQKYYLAAVDPINEMHELLTWAAQHYRIGLLSNIMPGFIAAMKEANLLPDVTYDVIIDSSEVGAIKPEEQIYKVAQQQAGCQPEHILLVDDERSNLMAAERMGWRVLWFDDFRPADSAQRVKQLLEY
ncbi:HAD-IA family hydrolase [Candidatus Saccharibacteria bacterium]|nr:HAD-IA family hydrolase [Candidatus Saccharibacteria bacterium]